MQCPTAFRRNSELIKAVGHALDIGGLHFVYPSDSAATAGQYRQSRLIYSELLADIGLKARTRFPWLNVLIAPLDREQQNFQIVEEFEAGALTPRVPRHP